MFRVALIGTGLIASRKHVPAWQRMKSVAKVVTLCDTDVQRANAVAGQLGISAVYEDAKTMMERERPDIVDICTPPRTHAALAVQALRSGAHVLIEKPMAVTTEECDLIIKAAAETDRKVCVAHSALFYPSFIKARELVDKGAIGTFRGMRILISTPVDYITSQPDHWAHRLAGGVIGETGPHVIYLTLAFINPIRTVQVHAQKLLTQFPWSPFEDYRLDFIGENAASSAALTYTTNQWAAQVDLWGDRGLIQVDLESRSLIRYSRTTLTPVGVGFSTLSEATQTVKSLLSTSTKVLTKQLLDTHSHLIQRFCESIQMGSEPPVTANAGREAVRVMDMIVERLSQPRT